MKWKFFDFDKEEDIGAPYFQKRVTPNTLQWLLGWSQALMVIQFGEDDGKPLIEQFENEVPELVFFKLFDLNCKLRGASEVK